MQRLGGEGAFQAAHWVRNWVKERRRGWGGG
jgi:hypothetical protein